MRGVRLFVDLESDAARLALRQVQNLGDDPTGLMETAGIILESSVRERFDRGRGPGGVPWKPARRVLAAARPSGSLIGPNRGGKTLVDQGNLLGSLRYAAERFRVIIGFDGFSESSKHAAAHQFGFQGRTVRVRHTRRQTQAFGVPLPVPRLVTVRGHVVNMNLPARPMLGVDAQDRADLIEGWQTYVRTRLK